MLMGVSILIWLLLSKIYPLLFKLSGNTVTVLFLFQSSETFDTFDLPEVPNFRSRCNTWPRQQLQQQLQQQQQQHAHVFMQQPTLREYQELGSVKEFGSSSALNSSEGGSFMLANRLMTTSAPWRPKVVTQVIFLFFVISVLESTHRSSNVLY